MSSRALLPIKLLIEGEDVVFLVDYELAVQFKKGLLTTEKLLAVIQAAA